MKNEKGLFIKDPDKWRIPRKLKKQIPKDTHYCYTPTSGMQHFKDGSYGYTIDRCTFWDYIKIKNMEPLPDYLDEEYVKKYGEEKGGWCKLVKCMIDDQCKSCGLKY